MSVVGGVENVIRVGECSITSGIENVVGIGACNVIGGIGEHNALELKKLNSIELPNCSVLECTATGGIVGREERSCPRSTGWVPNNKNGKRVLIL